MKECRTTSETFYQEKTLIGEQEFHLIWPLECSLWPWSRSDSLRNRQDQRADCSSGPVALPLGCGEIRHPFELCHYLGHRRNRRVEGHVALRLVVRESRVVDAINSGHGHTGRCCAAVSGHPGYVEGDCSVGPLRFGHQRHCAMVLTGVVHGCVIVAGNL